MLAYHITWATYGSRISEPVLKYSKRTASAVRLDEVARIIIASALAKKIKEKNYRVLALNVLDDHVHIVLVCEETELSEIIRELKGYSSFEYNRECSLSSQGEGRKTKLWAKGSYKKLLETEEQMNNAIEYVNSNHLKHGLSDKASSQNHQQLKQLVVPAGKAFEHLTIHGGFDIVIANPPYGNLIKEKEKKYIENNYKYSTLSDISSIFVERGFNLLKNKGNLVFIITYAITFNKDFSKSRELIANNFKEIYIFTFDRDRCKIFKSMTQTVSIIKCFNKNFNNKNGIYTSRMFRNTPDINKIEVTNCNKYLLPKNAKYDQKHRLPKIGEKINRQILEKMLQFNDSVGSIIKNSGSKIWIRTSGNYWYNAFDRKPYKSVKISHIYLNKDFANFLILLINSSLFYFWFRIYGDGRDMNRDILEEFPLPDKEKILKYNILLNKMKKRFMDKLFSVFDKKHNRFITSRIKSEIDLIDLILGKHFYNLEYNEIVHILNYDFEIRRGNKLEKPFIDIVDKILSITNDDDYFHNPNKQVKVKEYERQIDQLVYKLYELTDEEIAIIENK